MFPGIAAEGMEERRLLEQQRRGGIEGKMQGKQINYLVHKTQASLMMHDSENDNPQLQNGEQGLTTSPLRATVRLTH